MRHFLFASATAAFLSGPAFAGAPTLPSPPTPPNAPPVSITVNTSTTATGGGSVTTTTHSGPLTVSTSVALKSSILLGTSQSISVPGSSGGYTVP